METRIIAVRVQKIIMSGSSHMIGGIRYNEINDPNPNPEDVDSLRFAKPLFYNISQYPTVNEIVYVLAGPRDDYNSVGGISSYYLPPININGSVNHNAQPSEFNEEELEANSETGFGKGYFQEIENVRPLLPYEGDIILEGRYGQSLRFGSTIKGSHHPNKWSNEGEVGNPITIIRNGQSDKLKPPFNAAAYKHILEDVNGDDSSIYLCSNQQITNFQKAGVSPKDHPISYKHML